MSETEKLYQKDVYIKEWETVIRDSTELEDGKFKIQLASTAFFPEGGGQSSDQGTIQINEKKNKSIYKVFDVQEEEDKIVHFLQIVEGDLKPTADKKVTCQLDWERRFDNMQRHCGEHILSGIFYQECGGVNRGFHMGEDYMTVDISLEDEPTAPDAKKPNELTYEMAMHCQLLTNQVIWSNIPVTVFRFDSREEAEKMPLRKALAFDEDISIVCIGSPEKPADSVACCGTHPATTGQVGLLKIYKVEKYKNMFRVYFEAGQRALRDYDKKHMMLTELSNSYSSSIDEFPSKIKSLEEKLAVTKNQLHHMKKILSQGEIAKIDSALEKAEGKVLIHEVTDLSLDDTFNIGKNYMGKESCGGKLLMLYSCPDTSFILVSEGNIKCGQLVKDYASFYKGKGGGKDNNARAIFPSRENAMLFADLVTKHLS